MTGIDALAHAIECYTMKFAQPITDAVALMAIEYAHYIRRAFADGEDLKPDMEWHKPQCLPGFLMKRISCGRTRDESNTRGMIPVAHGQCVE
ncbi:iron-containing alcohol dehydrogenase [Bacillus sp. SL00103]